MHAHASTTNNRYRQKKNKQQNHRKKVGDKSTTTIKATERYPTHNTTNIYRPRPIAFNHHTSYIESLCVRLSVVCVIPVCSQSCMFAVCCRCYSIYIDLIKWFAYKYSVAASFGFELCFFFVFPGFGVIPTARQEHPRQTYALPYVIYWWLCVCMRPKLKTPASAARPYFPVCFTSKTSNIEQQTQTAQVRSSHTSSIYVWQRKPFKWLEKKKKWRKKKNNKIIPKIDPILCELNIDNNQTCLCVGKKEIVERRRRRRRRKTNKWKK